MTKIEILALFSEVSPFASEHSEAFAFANVFSLFRAHRSRVTDGYKGLNTVL